MIHKELLEFIREARERGFDDFQIKQPLLQEGWEIHEVEAAFATFKKPVIIQNKVCIYLDSDILRLIEKRATKNMLTISQQIEDILRRSVINAKGTKGKPEKLDDTLVGIFSRKKRSKAAPRKKKKKR